MDERDSEDVPSIDLEEKEECTNWIEWFCNIDGHEFFCEVPEDFIRDSFNLYGFRSLIPRFDEAIHMILSREAPDDEDFDNEVFMGVYQNAIDLYGQIHARFIRSPLGLATMKEKYLSGDFGICPRVLCDGQNALPLGESEELREYGVRLFCPKCKEAYIPSRRYENVDGACFGMSFPHILLETYTDLYIYEKGEEFIPKLYGFKIQGHRGSQYYEEPVEIEEEEKIVEESKE